MRKKTIEIKPIWPVLSWKRCIKCGDSIILEKMWKATERRMIRGWTCYVCTECAHTKEEVKKIFDNHLLLYYGPPIVPRPPKQKNRTDEWITDEI